MLTTFKCFIVYISFFSTHNGEIHVIQQSGLDGDYQTVAEKELNILKTRGSCVWLELSL